MHKIAGGIGESVVVGVYGFETKTNAACNENDQTGLSSLATYLKIKYLQFGIAVVAGMIV